MKIKRMVDTWWKIALWAAGGIVVALVIAGMIVGPPPVKATADNAVKACRSSSYGPRDETLGSRSSIRPDGTWTPRESVPGIYTIEQQVRDDTYSDTYPRTNPYTASPPWVCTAWMSKDGDWTAQWATSASAPPLTWHVKNSDLRSVAPPRDLSGPGYGG